MRNHTDVTVAAVIERDGRFLMVEEQVAGRLVVNQPAGHLELGETLVEAVIRETLEESARVFEPDAVVGVYLWHHSRLNRNFLRIAFSGTCHGHDSSRALDDGIIRALWCTRDQLLAQRPRLRSPLVLQCIDDYLSGIRYPLECINHIDVGSASRAAGP